MSRANLLSSPRPGGSLSCWTASLGPSRTAPRAARRGRASGGGARLLGEADIAHRPIAYVGGYDGQFHFEGRLLNPITELYGAQAVTDFARAHPDGVIVDHPEKIDGNALHYALLVQPFRSSWMVIWSAASLGDLYAGKTPPDPSRPTEIYTADAQRPHAQP